MKFRYSIPSDSSKPIVDRIIILSYTNDTFRILLNFDTPNPPPFPHPNENTKFRIAREISFPEALNVIVIS